MSKNNKLFKLFKDQHHIKSITQYDKDKRRHGRKISWWDKNHKYPKTLSIYHHGTILRSTKWYLNGNIKVSINTIGSKKTEVGYYSNGLMKFNKQFINNKKYGVWNGFYKNGHRQYTEKYENDILTGQAIYNYYNGNIKAIIDYDDGKEINREAFGLYSFLREDIDDNKSESSSSSKTSSSNFWDINNSQNEYEDNLSSNSQNSQNSDLENYLQTEKIFEELDEEEALNNSLDNEDEQLQNLLLQSYNNFKTI